MVSADVQIDPPDLVSDHPDWVTILSWQGRMENHRGLVIDRLDKVGPGHYRSTQPVPVWGSWKTLLRVQDGYTMTAVPICEPADDAIPAPEVPALASTAPGRSSKRSRSCSANATRTPRHGCSPPASIVVLIFTLMVIAALTWGAGRINNAVTEPEPVEEESTRCPRAA